MGVVSECCCKEVYIYYMIDILIIIITFPYSTCINSFFLAVSSLFLCSFLNVFLYFIIILQ